MNAVKPERQLMNWQTMIALIAAEHVRKKLAEGWQVSRDVDGIVVVPTAKVLK